MRLEGIICDLRGILQKMRFYFNVAALFLAEKDSISIKVS